MKQVASLLAKLSESEEPILIRNKRLYTAEQTDERPDLSVKGVRYRTYESETISNLENLWLDAHPETADVPENLGELVNRAYDKLTRVVGKERKPGKSSFRFNERKSSLCGILDGVFILFDGTIFQLDTGLNYTSEPEIEWKPGQKIYRPVQKLNMKRIEREYMERLAETSFKKKSNGNNKIRCTPKKGYLLFMLNIPEFIMQVRNSYFLFPAADVCVKLKKRQFSIESPARVMGKYHHPFVFRSGEICYGTFRRFEKIPFGTKIENNEKAAEWIAYLLHEARKTIESGYFRGVRPVEKLTKRNFANEWVSDTDAVKSGVRVIKQ